jgi:hypothetical protein
MEMLHGAAAAPSQADHGDMATRIARGDFELPA